MPEFYDCIRPRANTPNYTGKKRKVYVRIQEVYIGKVFLGSRRPALIQCGPFGALLYYEHFLQIV